MAHTYVSNHLHIVFSTKNRQRLIAPEWEDVIPPKSPFRAPGNTVFRVHGRILQDHRTTSSIYEYNHLIDNSPLQTTLPNSPHTPPQSISNYPETHLQSPRM